MEVCLRLPWFPTFEKSVPDYGLLGTINIFTTGTNEVKLVLINLCNELKNELTGTFLLGQSERSRKIKLKKSTFIFFQFSKIRVGRVCKTKN